MDKKNHLYMVIEITQLLAKNNCTYAEVDRILDILQEEFKEQRFDLEYDSLDDYFNEHKCHDADNMTVKALNHVDELL